MAIPERFSNLPDYAFPRLRRLLGDTPPGGPVRAMSIGEPQHPFPDWVGGVIAAHVSEFGHYPPNEGTPELLDAIRGWIGRRYGVEVGPERVTALNGTREGLFNTVLSLCPERKGGAVPTVLIPNPFYQVYAVGAVAAGAQPVYVPATAATGFLPDYAGLPRDLLDRAAIAFVCSPANPQGVVASRDWLADLLDLAERHDFRVFSDECYSEIYREMPPPGLLEVAADRGTDPERAVVFHSLSKRSNLPGLRSGFVAAGPRSSQALRRLRTFAGAPLPLPLQRVAERAWADDAHVVENRARYGTKYDIADRVFASVQGAAGPEAGFFLWLPVDDGERAVARLWSRTGIRALPGAYLARDGMTDDERPGDDGQGNPGRGYIRVAMVSNDDAGFEQDLTDLRDCLYG